MEEVVAGGEADMPRMRSRRLTIMALGSMITGGGGLKAAGGGMGGSGSNPQLASFTIS